LQDTDETELAPEFFQRLDPTFLHIIRNSLDHGIEDSEERLAAGKEPLATITCVSARRNGNIVFSIGDDGRGINLQRIQQIAVERGFLARKDVETMAREDIVRLLFLPGFSSKDAVTDMSGRGVGLDVVAKDVKRLQGHLRVITRPGKGTTFELRYPLPG
jgi:two-component system chemotaxis sensor kinase CheA